jgi:two-component system response regulator HydG
MSDADFKNRLSILVIDDEFPILDSIARQLKNENVQLELINNPLEGIEKIKKNTYNLVICDIRMKELTGIEVLKRIKKIKPSLPVIILTGFVDDNIMHEAKKSGCSDFLIKPVRKSLLIDAIYNCLKATD